MVVKESGWYSNVCPALFPHAMISWPKTCGLVAALLLSYTSVAAELVCTTPQRGVVIGPRLAIGRAVGKSFGDCCTQCTAVPACRAFTFEQSEQLCYFKNSSQTSRAKASAVSGKVVTPPSPPPPPAFTLTPPTTAVAATAADAAARELYG